MKKFTIVAVATALALAISGVPASAAVGSSSSTMTAKPANPSGHSRYKATDNAAAGSTDGIACWGEDSPVPQYSASNRTVHYGFKTLCNYSDAMLWMHMWLYSIAGSGENEHPVYQSDKICQKPGDNLPCGEVLQCVVRTTGRWYAVVYATATTLGELPPYPAQGPTQTLGCSDVL